MRETAALLERKVGVGEGSDGEGGVCWSRSTASLRLRQLHNKLLCVSASGEKLGSR